MGRIGECFARLGQKGESALVPFITAGDPDLQTSEALVLALSRAGADLIEIGVPFSDPIAEGPTIQRADERALASGASLRHILRLVNRVRAEIQTPLILMGYANPFYAMGPDNLADMAASVGVDGLICPDLPPEDGAELYDALALRGVDGILLSSPTTSRERLEMLMHKSRGFLYHVSLTGVTGARDELAQGIQEQVDAARAFGSLPVCVGFGVSTPEQAARVGRFADGVVVGSAIIDRIEAAPDKDAALESVFEFTAELKAALRGIG